MKEYEKAAVAFDRAAERNPDHADTYLHRAMAAQGRKKYDDALKDLDRAVAAGAPKTRAAFMRARVYDLSGDKDAAKRELDEALKSEPTDDLTWIARANAQVNTDPTAALKDFDAALAVNPRSMAALQNKSFVLSRLGSTRTRSRPSTVWSNSTPASCRPAPTAA